MEIENRQDLVQLDIFEIILPESPKRERTEEAKKFLEDCFLRFMTKNLPLLLSPQVFSEYMNMLTEKDQNILVEEKMALLKTILPNFDNLFLETILGEKVSRLIEYTNDLLEINSFKKGEESSAKTEYIVEKRKEKLEEIKQAISNSEWRHLNQMFSEFSHLE